MSYKRDAIRRGRQSERQVKKNDLDMYLDTYYDRVHSESQGQTRPHNEHLKLMQSKIFPLSPSCGKSRDEQTASMVVDLDSRTKAGTRTADAPECRSPKAATSPKAGNKANAAETHDTNKGARAKVRATLLGTRFEEQLNLDDVRSYLRGQVHLREAKQEQGEYYEMLKRMGNLALADKETEALLRRTGASLAHAHRRVDRVYNQAFQKAEECTTNRVHPLIRPRPKPQPVSASVEFLVSKNRKAMAPAGVSQSVSELRAHLAHTKATLNLVRKQAKLDSAKASLARHGLANPNSHPNPKPNPHSRLNRTPAQPSREQKMKEQPPRTTKVHKLTKSLQSNTIRQSAIRLPKDLKKEKPGLFYHPVALRQLMQLMDAEGLIVKQLGFSRTAEARIIDHSLSIGTPAHQSKGHDLSKSTQYTQAQVSRPLTQSMISPSIRTVNQSSRHRSLITQAQTASSLPSPTHQPQ